MPFVQVHRIAPKPLPYPANPVSLADYLKKRRFELGLRQRDVAERLGVENSTLLSWEKGHKRPMDMYLPRIIAFLGYDPQPAPASLGDQIRAKRKALGLSGKAAARRLGVDEGTLSRWERGIWKPKGRRRKLVEKLLSDG